MSLTCFDEILWPNGSAPPLAANDAHIWGVALDDTSLRLDELVMTLSGAERTRADRFKFARDRDAFIAAHGALRSILCGYLGLEAQEIVFTEGAHGKPELSGGMAGSLRFNLSHTHGAALIGVTREARIGVDIERVRENTPILDLARRFFHPDEAYALEQTPPERQVSAFFTTWTRKEALVKAHGDGLGHLLQAFAVSVDNAAEVLVKPAGEEKIDWRVYELPVGMEYRASVACDRAMTLRRQLWR
ncbi:MAG: phosphopantetheine-protein transferase [Capsulimonas sp.]|jgi:4'-phosphopantetheinyl transferase|nr:phosphopantetheine-protein transferase [Capsulimonas sp.]